MRDRLKTSADSTTRNNLRQVLTTTIFKLLPALGLFALASSVQAGSATWVGAGADGLWDNPLNWSPGIPGSTSAITTADVATFNSVTPQMVVGIDAIRYIRSLTFDTNAGAYTIGDILPNQGNPLFVTQSGSISIASGFVGTGVNQTINAPLIITPSTATANPGYSLVNNSADPSNSLRIFGGISVGTTSGVGTLTLNGANTGANILDSVNGANAGFFNIVKSGIGTWNITGTVTTKGVGQNGGINVAGGTLNFTSTANVTIAGKSVFTTDSVTNSAGTVSLGGNLGGTPGDYITVGDGSNATLNVTGGTFTVTPSTGKSFVLGTLDTAGTATGTVNVSGGTLQVTNIAPIRFGSYDGNIIRNGTGILNISGTGLFDTGSTTGAFVLGDGSATSSGTINLDGGTFQTNRNITKGDGSATINFNGGTLKSVTTSTTLINAAVTTYVKAGGAVFDTNGFNLTINPALQADPVSTGGGLTKKSGGTLTIGSVSTYTGPTNIEAGSLKLSASGSISGSTRINVFSGATFDVSSVPGGFSLASGQTLAGSGLVTGAVTAATGSKIAPGSSAGTLNVNGAIAFAAGSTLALEITGTSPGDGPGFYDQLNMNSAGGSITLDGAAQITLSLSGFTPSASDKFFVLNRVDAGTYSSFFASAGEGATVNLGNGYTGQITYLGDVGASSLTGGNDVAIYNVVPEPGSVSALFAGLGSLAGLQRFRRRRV